MPVFYLGVLKCKSMRTRAERDSHESSYHLELKILLRMDDPSMPMPRIRAEVHTEHIAENAGRAADLLMLPQLEQRRKVFSVSIVVKRFKTQ